MRSNKSLKPTPKVQAGRVAWLAGEVGASAADRRGGLTLCYSSLEWKTRGPVRLARRTKNGAEGLIMLEQIVTILGSATILVAAVAWITRSVINHFLSRDVEAYKARVKADLDVSLVQFRSELEIRAQEHNIVFSKMHERRAQVITDLYERLVEAIWAASSFVSIFGFQGEPSKEEQYKAAMEKMGVFYRFFDKARIYLKQDLCKRIDDLFEKLRTPVIEYSTYIQFPPQFSEGEREKMDTWVKAWKKVSQDDVPAARNALEIELRKILGAE